MLHEELKGWDNIDISSDRQSLSLQVMIGTIEGVAHGKMGGDGMEGGASAGSSERPRKA